LIIFYWENEMKRLLLSSLVLVVVGGLQGCVSAPLIAAAGIGGAGVMVAQDRRTASVLLDDESIENKSMAAINQNYATKTAHINVTSFNRNVLVSGEVKNTADRLEIARQVASVENVRVVYNQLVVSPTTSIGSRSNDTMITSDVKLGLARVKNFRSDYVKVVTENSTVFLMGLVNHSEAGIAADVASTTNGVARVVKLFEYID
jgi:osmotically-inducible protein OsmY